MRVATGVQGERKAFSVWIFNERDFKSAFRVIHGVTMAIKKSISSK